MTQPLQWPKDGTGGEQKGASRSPRHTQHLWSTLRSIHTGTSQLDLAGWHVRNSRHEVSRWCHADPTGGGTPPSTWGALPTSHQRTRPTAKLSKRFPNGFKLTTDESALELETSKFTQHYFLRRWMFLITPRTTELFKRKSEKGDFPRFCQHQHERGCCWVCQQPEAWVKTLSPGAPFVHILGPLSPGSTHTELGGTVSKPLSRNFLGPFSLSLLFRGKHREPESRKALRRAKSGQSGSPRKCSVTQKQISVNGTICSTIVNKRKIYTLTIKRWLIIKSHGRKYIHKDYT